MNIGITKLIITIIAGYLLGNISPSFIIGKLSNNIDIRQHGSGNAGTTNTLRVLGAKKAGLVLLIDALKGTAAAQLGMYLGGQHLAMVGAIAVIVGHVFPVFMKFKGGKGVATTLGALWSIFPMYGLISILIGVAVILKTRFVSLGSIVGTSAITLLLYFVKADPWTVSASALISLFIMYTHRENIKRLRNKTERRLGEK